LDYVRVRTMSKVRSGPVYVEREGEIVSLVFEGEAKEEIGVGVRSAGRNWVGRPDVFVIDADGVRFVRRSGGEVGEALVLGAVIYFALWCVGRVFRKG
jgi:hypothetical protein